MSQARNEFTMVFDRWDDESREWRLFGQTENGEVVEVERP